MPAARAKTETWIQRIWYQDHTPPFWLRGLVPLYRGLLHWRQGVQRRNRWRCPVPVVVIGNLTAGGSGKTPLVIRLAELLQEAGLKPGVVSRGYGRIGVETARVTPGGDAELLGDEPVMIAERCGCPVYVSSDRVATTDALTAHEDVDVVLSDDGLQHLKLERDLEICVIDGERRFGNGLLLPAGPLREPVTRLDVVDWVVVKGEADAGEMGMRLEPDGAYRLDAPGTLHALDTLRGHRLHALAGIGNPRGFFQTLEAAGLDIRPHAFPDHHHYSDQDLRAFPADAELITTEKDAVKLRRLEPDQTIWVVRASARLPRDFEQAFVTRVRELTGAER